MLTSKLQTNSKREIFEKREKSLICCTELEHVRTEGIGLREDSELLEVVGQLEEAVVGVGHGDVDARQRRGEDGGHGGEKRRLPHRELVLLRHLVLFLLPSSTCKLFRWLAVWARSWASACAVRGTRREERRGTPLQLRAAGWGHCRWACPHVSVARTGGEGPMDFGYASHLSCLVLAFRKRRDLEYSLHLFLWFLHGVSTLFFDRYDFLHGVSLFCAAMLQGLGFL